jgi:hypothetical protein
MNGSHKHRLAAFSSVTVNNLDIGRARRAIRPLKATAPLPIDPDREPAGAVALQRFEPVAWQSSQSGEIRRRVQNGEPLRGLVLKPLKRPDKSPCGKGFRFFLSR